MDRLLATLAPTMWEAAPPLPTAVGHDRRSATTSRKTKGGGLDRSRRPQPVVTRYRATGRSGRRSPLCPQKMNATCPQPHRIKAKRARCGARVRFARLRPESNSRARKRCRPSPPPRRPRSVSWMGGRVGVRAGTRQSSFAESHPGRKQTPPNAPAARMVDITTKAAGTITAPAAFVDPTRRRGRRTARDALT